MSEYCNQQILKRTIKRVTIPFDAKDSTKIELEGGSSITINHILVPVINRKKDTETIINKGDLISYVCGNQLTVAGYGEKLREEDDAPIQLRDKTVLCDKENGGCGFYKSAGNEEWTKEHCMHCGSKLGDTDENMTCSKCKDNGLIKGDVLSIKLPPKKGGK